MSRIRNRDSMIILQFQQDYVPYSVINEQEDHIVFCGLSVNNNKIRLDFERAYFMHIQCVFVHVGCIYCQCVVDNARKTTFFFKF